MKEHELAQEKYEDQFDSALRVWQFLDQDERDRISSYLGDLARKTYEPWHKGMDLTKMEYRDWVEKRLHQEDFTNA